MPKITIEINDTLQEKVDSAIDDVKRELEQHWEQNPDDSFPDLGLLDYSGAIHQIIDSSVPIYAKEIEDIWYLHKRELENAYEIAGTGVNPLENDGMTAIFYYIYDQVSVWYDDNAESIWDDMCETNNDEEGKV